MAGVGLLALIDDIATLLDDVALLSKVAAKKTAGVLGDDLALNAEQVSGVRADRELPVVWAVAKGSALNKLILVPAALLISAVASWLITPLLMLGGGYLCFEGFEKISHKWLHGNDNHEDHSKKLQALSDPTLDVVAFEKNKIKGAIRTDFVLSAEIVVISLGVVQAVSFSQQVLVVSLIAAVITVGVYGLVAGIVKLDDAGYYLLATRGKTVYARFKRRLGRGVLAFCPYLMRSLAVVGTAAMFLVGGGILMHGIPAAHHLQELAGQSAVAMQWDGNILEVITPTLSNALMGVISGGVLVAAMSMYRKVTSLFS